MLLHPKCFNPVEPIPSGAFLWPWQRSISIHSANFQIKYKAQQTTSLVFDLRKSTIALEQLPSKEIAEFSPFIKKIVFDAKEAILDYGGFFDKETGDGVVGHFVNFDDPSGSLELNTAVQRSFEAALAIVRKTSITCNQFQAKLRFGIENLGASVGLHTGDAVWMTEDNEIRAIGESAIMASRLCDEAPCRSVFLSNSFFNDLKNCVGAERMTKFYKKSYSGKEIKDGAGLYGFVLEVSDTM